MLIGVPKEIKSNEGRVGLVRSSVRELATLGHNILIESGAGAGVGIADQDYEQAGAAIAGNAEEVFSRAEMIVKVKEPQPVEIAQLKPGQVLFTYLHLAPDPEQARGLLESGCTAIAYETVTDSRGGLPLLAPMSEIAGRLSIQVGAHSMQRDQGGPGVLLGGVTGTDAAKVAVIGGGVSGCNAVKMAVGLGAHVVVLDKSLDRLRDLDNQYSSKIQTIYATRDAIERCVIDADLVIGAVLVPGAAAPKLVTADLVRRMKVGAVVVDISIDQGGCFETSRATTHASPTYVVDGVIHYCVTNMPGCVARTAAAALNNATLPLVAALSNKGVNGALAEDPHLRNGLNVHRGRLTHPAVAAALGADFVPPQQALTA